VHPSSRWLFVMADLMADPPKPGACDFDLAGREEGGTVTITAAARGAGRHELILRAFNLDVDPAPRKVNLQPGTPATVAWTAKVLQAGTPWVAAAIADGDASRVRDVVGFRSPAGAR